MDHNVDGSEGSADEGLATVSAPPLPLSPSAYARAKTEQQQPPPDRPHRDRRRTQGSGPEPVLPSHLPHQSPYGPQHSAQFERQPSDMTAVAAPMVPGPGGYPVPANAISVDGQYIYIPPSEHPTLRQQQSGQAPGYPMPPAPLPHMNGMHSIDGVDDRQHDHPAMSRPESSAGEIPHQSSRPNGASDRRILPSSSDPSANAGTERPGASGGFTAVNHHRA